MSAPWTCPCGARNRGQDALCEDCGAPRTPSQGGAQGGARGDAQGARAHWCPYDGATLMANGLCPHGNGYPVGLPSPFACPQCRRPLAWSGLCLTCSDPTGKTVGFCPGDRYEYMADNPHWVLVEKGPFTLCTPEEMRDHARRYAQTIATLAARWRVEL